MSDNNHNDNDDANQQAKDTAFGICFLRTMLSLLPDEAGLLKYDSQTPHFEGVALEFRPAVLEMPWGDCSLEAARTNAAAFSDFMTHTRTFDKWNGFSFAIYRTHYVDQLILDSVTLPSSPIRQIVLCGVGQDYRAMRHGKAIHNHYGTKVFELDLAVMMKLRSSVKKRILNEIGNRTGEQPIILPETYPLSIDFGTQHVSQVLLDCPAFDPTLPTLYLWEGVSYYLTPEAMKSFFQDIVALMKMAPLPQQQHHRLFFDHLIDVPRLIDTEQDSTARAMLDMFQDSEPLRSFLDYDQVDVFLQKLGLCVDQQVQPPQMYRPYQKAVNDMAYHLEDCKYFGLVVAKPMTA